MLRELARFLVGNLAFAVLLAVGLETRLVDLGEMFAKRRMLLRALIVIEIAVPLLAILVVKLVEPPRVPGGVVLLFAICPGVALLPFTVGRKGGRVPTAVGLLLALTALSPITVPLGIAILDEAFGAQLQVDLGELVAKLIPTVLIPLGIGMTIRHFYPRTGERLARWVSYFIFAALAVVVVILLGMGRQLLGILAEVRPVGALAFFALIVGSMFLGHWAGAPDLADRKAVAVAAVLGNPALVLLIVKSSYPDLRVGVFVAVYLIARVLMMIPYSVWVKRKGQSARPAVPPATLDAGAPHPRPL